jgi:Glyoxalase-like domain
VVVPSVGAVGLDCADPAALGEFWSALLDGEIVLSTDDVVAIRVGALVVNAYRVDEYVAPTWPRGGVPKQLHLDLAIDDLAGAVERAIALGATVADEQPFPDSHLVLLDPAGHPFCLTTEFSTLPAVPD